MADDPWGEVMDVRESMSDEGLRVVTVERPYTTTAAIHVYVRAGSRYDGQHPGAAHLLEHLIFQGTRKRSSRDLYAAIDRIGGEIGARTTKEYINLYVVLPNQHLLVGLEILADVLTSPLLENKAFWQEKLIILEEIRQAQDKTGVIYDLFSQVLWQVHPFRTPTLGNLLSLHSMTHEDVTAFYSRQFITGNTVVVVCSPFDHEEVFLKVVERFDGLVAGPQRLPEDVDEPPLTGPRQAHLEKDIHQIHALLGMAAVGMKHPDRSAIKVIERVLGMGSSARLFQRLRERDNLVYSVNTALATYEDVGFLGVYTTCRPENSQQVKNAILDEIERLTIDGISVGELTDAQNNYAGTLVRRFETNSAVASILGIEALLHRIEPLADSIARIRAVTREEVSSIARRYLTPDRYVWVTVGRGR